MSIYFVCRSMKHTEGFACVEATQALNNCDNDDHQSTSSASSCDSVTKPEYKQPLAKETENST